MAVLVFGSLRVEDSEGIGLGAAAVVFAHGVFDGGEGFAEGGDVAGAIRGGAYGVEFQLPALDAEFVEEGGEHFEDFGVADGAFGAAEVGPRTSAPICQNWR